jgi:hypothetical protein
VEGATADGGGMSSPDSLITSRACRHIIFSNLLGGVFCHFDPIWQKIHKYFSE